jgi:hypothetical protein
MKFGPELTIAISQDWQSSIEQALRTPLSDASQSIAWPPFATGAPNRRSKGRRNAIFGAYCRY